MLTPKRLVLGGCGAALVCAGILWPLDSSGGGSSGLGLFGLGIYGLGLIAIGTALLISAVVLPSVKEVEFGFPMGVKVTTAVSNREEALRQEFDRQRSDLELCAQLLCDDRPGSTRADRRRSPRLRWSVIRPDSGDHRPVH